MTHVEFLRWEQELEDELNERSATEWQIATVAYEVYLLRHVLSHLFSKSVPKPSHTLKDFLVTFKTAEPPTATKDEIKRTRKLAEARSKNAASVLKSAMGAGATGNRRN